MSVEAISAAAAIAQGVGTLGAFYLTIFLLRETGRGVRTALRDHGTRLAPYLTLAGQIETAVGAGERRIVLVTRNEGPGPAVEVVFRTSIDLANVQIEDGETCGTSEGGIAILRSDHSSRWFGEGGQVRTGGSLPVDLRCRDVAGGEWSFQYSVGIPESSGPVRVVLTGVSRPSLPS